MPYKKQKVKTIFFIEKGKVKEVVEGLIDPTPSIFETSDETEVRFSVEVSNNFLKQHSYDGLLNKKITVGMIYPDSDIEIKSTFKVTHYERRFGSNKGPHITHVLKGDK